jgi:hypothetical protein
MEENQYARVIYYPLEKITKNGVEYTFFCKRKEECVAKLVANDIRSNGKEALVTKVEDGFVVWKG